MNLGSNSIFLQQRLFSHMQNQGIIRRKGHIQPTGEEFREGIFCVFEEQSSKNFKKIKIFRKIRKVKN